MPRLPFSLLFFAATAALFVAQTVPGLGFVLMMMLAMFWSGILINLGMIGIAVEAASARVSRWWLVIPIIFYAVYAVFALREHIAFANLNASYEARNAQATIEYRADRALGFDDWEMARSILAGYKIDVAYARSIGSDKLWSSLQIAPGKLCREIRKQPNLVNSEVREFGVSTRPNSLDGHLNRTFCGLQISESPNLPIISITRGERTIAFGPLSVRQVIIRIATPDGVGRELLSGRASVLSWLPLPVVGCIQEFGTWSNKQCGAQFSRNLLPIIAQDTREPVGMAVLARALKLTPSPAEERQPIDESALLQRIEAVKTEARRNDEAVIERAIGNPLAAHGDRKPDVEFMRGAISDARARQIVSALERAARATGSPHTATNGLILADLAALLSEKQFKLAAPRLRALYRPLTQSTSPPGWKGAAQPTRVHHWLWEAGSLQSRLAELDAPPEPEPEPIIVTG